MPGTPDEMNLRRTIAKVNDFATRLRNTRIYDQRTAHQLQELTVLRRIFDEFSVDCIFDISANQGQYAPMLRRNVRFKGAIISVQPNPGTFSVLKSKSKSDTGWHSENIALADHDGERPKMAGHQLTNSDDPVAAENPNVVNLDRTTKRVGIPLKTLKTLYLEARNAGHFARPFLKMDTQGHDSVIVRSAGETIRQFVGIQTDLSFAGLYSGSIPFQDSLDLYDHLGFTLCAIVPNNAGHFPYLQDAIFVNTEFLEAGTASG
jgi:FkbM family methyltransferase